MRRGAESGSGVTEQEPLRVTHVTRAINRETGVSAPVLWLTTTGRPDVADLVRVVTDDPDSAVRTDWRVGSTATSDGPLMVLQVEILAPVRCTFVVHFDPGKDRGLLEEVIERDGLGLVLGPEWQEGAQLDQRYVLPVDDAIDRLRFLLTAWDAV